MSSTTPTATNNEKRIPTFDDVKEAAQRLHGHAHRTPVLTSSRLNQELFGNTSRSSITTTTPPPPPAPTRIFFKCENFQRIGAFKFRGAYNTLARLPAQQRAAGVVTYSSGNHAQAVALSAKLHSTPAYIIMPHDAPALKVAATRGYGAHVILYDRYKDSREQIAHQLLAEHPGMSLISPFDHPDVIAGQGTVAKELLEDVEAMRAKEQKGNGKKETEADTATPTLDALFVPLGGGGLLSGTAITVAAMCPRCMVYGVEPLAGNDGQQSLRAGRIVSINVPRTIADGAQTQSMSALTFGIMRRHVMDIKTATDEELVACMKYVASTMKVVVEPTGCLGLAAALQMKDQLQGKRVGIIVSGGNVDMSTFAALMQQDTSTTTPTSRL